MCGKRKQFVLMRAQAMIYFCLFFLELKSLNKFAVTSEHVHRPFETVVLGNQIDFNIQPFLDSLAYFQG